MVIADGDIGSFGLFSCILTSVCRYLFPVCRGLLPGRETRDTDTKRGVCRYGEILTKQKEGNKRDTKQIVKNGGGELSPEIQEDRRNLVQLSQELFKDHLKVLTKAFKELPFYS